MPPPCCAIQLRHPPFRSGTCFPPRLGAQSEQLKHPPQYGHANVSARRSTVSCGYLRGHQSQSNFFGGDRCNGRTVSRCNQRSILCATARLPTHRSLYSTFWACACCTCNGGNTTAISSSSSSSSACVSWNHQEEEAQARILRAYSDRLRRFRDHRRHL